MMKGMKRLKGGKMKSLFLLLLTVSLFSLTVVMAASDTTTTTLTGPFKAFQCVQLKQICGNCSYVNITSISYPNSTVAVAGVLMTQSGTEYTYTFCNTSVIGTYIVNGNGNVDGGLIPWAYDFQITPDGTRDKSLAILIIFGLSSLALVGMGVMMKNAYLGFIGGMMFLTIGVYTMINGFVDTADVYTRGFSTMLIGVGAFFTIVAAYEWAVEDIFGV